MVHACACYPYAYPLPPPLGHVQYTFEILTWLGIALTSQHLYAYLVCTAMGVYLTGRAYATRQWYTDKFDTFPSGRKLLLPLLL